MLLVLATKRYAVPRIRIERTPSKMEHYLFKLRPSEFKLHFRLDREYFFVVCELVAGDPIFASIPEKRQKASVAAHMLCLMKMLGTTGCEASFDKLADFFSLGKGTVEMYVNRAIASVDALHARVITWPDSLERAEISSRVSSASGFGNCGGFIDGTLFPLALSPRLCGEDYYLRKSSYAVNGLIVCDDAARIRYLHVGWPGSTHDNRVWRNCDLVLNSSNYFTSKEYLLGDSAFQPSNILLSAYKNGRGFAMSGQQELFNQRLATVRIKAEHCIGMLKGRFPFLRKIRSTMASKTQLAVLVRTVRVGCSPQFVHW